jgi:hypothetical protein
LWKKEEQLRRKNQEQHWQNPQEEKLKSKKIVDELTEIKQETKFNSEKISISISSNKSSKDLLCFTPPENNSCQQSSKLRCRQQKSETSRRLTQKEEKS